MRARREQKKETPAKPSLPRPASDAEGALECSFYAWAVQKKRGKERGIPWEEGREKKEGRRWEEQEAEKEKSCEARGEL